MTDYDDTQEEGNATTRRRFLGAATAAASLVGLTGASAATTTDADTTRDNSADRDAGGGDDSTDGEDIVFAALNLRDDWQDNIDYEVNGPYHEEEAVDVEVSIPMEIGSITLAFTEAEAEAFTDQVLATARETIDE